MAIRLDLPRGVTDDDLLALSERNPGYQFERSPRGQLIVSPTGTEGGRRSGEVFLQLAAWNRAAGLGVVFDSSTGFNLPDGSCLSPDASWVRQNRWDALSSEQREGFAPLCPDVVFEVRSRSNTAAELREKLQAYLANGARLAVFLDPDEGAVELQRAGHDPERIAPAGVVGLDPELPGFTLDVRPVFLV